MGWTEIDAYVVNLTLTYLPVTGLFIARLLAAASTRTETRHANQILRNNKKGPITLTSLVSVIGLTRF